MYTQNSSIKLSFTCVHTTKIKINYVNELYDDIKQEHSISEGEIKQISQLLTEMLQIVAKGDEIDKIIKSSGKDICLTDV